MIRLSDPENDVAAANAVEEYRKARQGDFFGIQSRRASSFSKSVISSVIHSIASLHRARRAAFRWLSSLSSPEA